MNIKNISIFDVIYMWLNLRNELFNKLEHNDSIYLYFDGQDYADIRIDKKRNYVYYDKKVYEEFSNVIFGQSHIFESVMCMWVRDTFNLTDFTRDKWGAFSTGWIKIPK